MSPWIHVGGDLGPDLSGPERSAAPPRHPRCRARQTNRRRPRPRTPTGNRPVPPATRAGRPGIRPPQPGHPAGRLRGPTLHLRQTPCVARPTEGTRRVLVVDDALETITRIA